MTNADTDFNIFVCTPKIYYIPKNKNLLHLHLFCHMWMIIRYLYLDESLQSTSNTAFFFFFFFEDEDILYIQRI